MIVAKTPCRISVDVQLAVLLFLAATPCNFLPLPPLAGVVAVVVKTCQSKLNDGTINGLEILII